MRILSLVAGAAVVLSTSLAFGQRSVGSAHAGQAQSRATSGYTGIVGGARSPGVYSGARAPIAPPSIGLQTYYSGYTGIAPGPIPRSGRVNGRGYGAGFVGFPLYYSTFDDYSQPAYYNNYVQDPSAQTSQVTANLLGEQIGRLSSEVEELRAQSATPAAYPVYNSPQADPPAPNDPPITLVLNNGSKMILQSYAVMGQNFWDFSRQPARKIPVSSVNLAASEKATEAAGGEFPMTR